ncbi:hypothetical protein MKK88_09565 [Methylobacterium sp. E-005]|uniref:hypothetical protein n=1 Tax=Methylobacterium sp. E-005 TaxID=2836549 RepID=UPI001FBB4675|nr:hypothetical protein [Methylobacterium sp. E-005]MCJ2086241.1 hypothetical protein [Methylobacterium sp. E-005]
MTVTSGSSSPAAAMPTPRMERYLKEEEQAWNFVLVKSGTNIILPAFAVYLMTWRLGLTALVAFVCLCGGIFNYFQFKDASKAQQELVKALDDENPSGTKD